MKQRVIGIWITVLWSTLVSGQTILTTTAILESSKKSPVVSFQEDKINLYKNSSFSLPFFERAAVQTETDRFELQRQEYTGRAWFNGFLERKAYFNQKLTNIAFEEASKNVYFLDNLYEKYQTILTYKQSVRLLDYYVKLLDILKDKRLIFQRKSKMASSDFDIQDLIKNEELIFEYQQKINDNTSNVLLIQNYWKRVLNINDSIQITDNQFVLIETIESEFKSGTFQVENHPSFQKQQSRISISEADLRLEKAQNLKLLDYFQVRTNTRNRDVLIRDWTLGIGIQIPYKASSKIKQQQILIDIKEESNQLQLLKINFQEQLSRTKQELELLFQRHSELKQQIAESQSVYTIEQYEKIKGADPLVLLRMKELHLHSAINLILMENAIYQKYISLLKTSGQLSQVPLRNYLSNTNESF